MRITEFIIFHNKEFNGMFSKQFNFDIENFIYELNKCLLNKISVFQLLPSDYNKESLPKIFYNHLGEYEHLPDNSAGMVLDIY